MNIIVSGGGTGGHIYPAITIVSAIQKKIPNANFLYVGTSKGLEADIVPKAGLNFKTIDIEGFKRSLSLDNFRRAGKAMLGVAKAMKIVAEFKPDVVIGTGGYVCGPILMAASLKEIPTLIQEQNVVPGITNKILAKFVTKIACGCEDAMKHFPKEKTVFTGNPIRAAVMSADRKSGAAEFNFDSDKKTILISGGSRGARSINRAMVGVLAAVKEDTDAQYLLVTGKNEYNDVINRLVSAGVDLEKSNHIRVKPYLYDMPAAMAMADVAVFRAGATGLAELTAKGIPSILIPYPYAAENHQEFNARALEKHGAARVILNSDLNSEVLLSTIRELLRSDAKLKKMAAASKELGRPQAADTIADLVLSIAR